MADATLTTIFSRRSILAGASASALCAAPGAPSQPSRRQAGEGLAIVPRPASGDMRLMLLAREYRRAQAALSAWIDMAERHLGPHGYIEPAYRPRYDALCAHEDWLVAELARTRPASIFGFAAKLRACVCYDYTGKIPRECDDRLLVPILDDLDWLAENALFGASA